ncbi:Karyogamy protein KAR4 [Candida viswanathii]|uniref:Karyogamy protein KAR4 n=1 Tax=Candida viswanathii TaxID=5486 RepID=A0A367YAA8_9ASCO|nr:Karyogamy protein KAR4 [Candida viswanathii]
MYTYNKFGSRASSSTSSTNNTTLTHTSSKTTTESSDSRTFTTRASKQVDYCNRYIHTGQSGIKYIRNVNNSVEGYPKLAKLHHLKRLQVKKHALQPYGVRCSTDQIVPTLTRWIEIYNLKFDVIMIGALVENQFILPILNSIPIHKLCSKPGFLFIWSTTQKIQELTKLLNNENFNKRFRRSEELIFLPIDKKSPYYPKGAEAGSETIPLFERQQWHCWMCITGTVRRSTDNYLIHCNIDTDLQIEANSPTVKKRGSAGGVTLPAHNAVPEAIYRVAENFSNANRRLHLIPSKLGYDTPIRLRPGWVIMGPDVLINNFDPNRYNEELYAKSMIKYKQNASGGGGGGSGNNNNTNVSTQFLVLQTNEIEDLRPKSPVISAK